MKYIFGIVFGLLVFGWTFLRVLQNIRLFRQGISSRGTVIRLERTWGSRRSLFPVIRFLTEKKEWITFRSVIGSYPPDYKEGDEVNVRFLPDKPEIAEIDSIRTLLYLPLGFLVLSIAGVAYFTYEYWIS
jgi:hypothetical protein